MKLRLNKYLALCGLGSRRKVESLITEGRVAVNGDRVDTLAFLVDTETDAVTLDGAPLSPAEKQVYLILYKPKGYITTVHDDRGRPIVMDIVPEKYKRQGVFPVGRLDKDTEGILLLTNDGVLARDILSPKSHFRKEYRVELDRPVSDRDVSRIKRGMYIHQLKLKTRPAEVTVSDRSRKHLTVALIEGKNRQIRYTFQNLGYRIKNLRRESLGPLTLEGLNRGSHRTLRKIEIQKLKDELYPRG